MKIMILYEIIHCVIFYILRKLYYGKYDEYYYNFVLMFVNKQFSKVNVMKINRIQSVFLGGIALFLIFIRSVNAKDSVDCIEGEDKCPNDRIKYYYYYKV